MRCIRDFVTQREASSNRKDLLNKRKAGLPVKVESVPVFASNGIVGNDFSYMGSTGRISILRIKGNSLHLIFLKVIYISGEEHLDLGQSNEVTS